MMTRLRLAILVVLFVVASAQAPAEATLPGPGLRVTVHETADLQSPQVYLGLAVLAPGESEIEHGVLMPRTHGYLHVDWVGAPSDWSKAAAGPPNPHDTSPTQIQAAIAAIEHLGFAANAIRSWRRPVPAFRGGGTVEIGEILVNLGLAQQASKSLAKFSDDPDPFAHVPANVTFGPLLVRPDCAALAKEMNDQATAAAGTIASTVSATLGQRVTFTGVTAGAHSPILCAATDEPELPYTSYEAPPGRYDFPYTQTATVRYALGTAGSAPRAATPVRAHDEATPTRLEGHDFALPRRVRYAATIGDANGCNLTEAILRSRAKAQAAARVLHAHLGSLLAITANASSGGTCEYGTAIDAAWELLPSEDSNAAPKAPREYVGTAAIGAPAKATQAQLRALINALRLAGVDGARTRSFYERAFRLYTNDDKVEPEGTDTLIIWSTR